MNGWCGRAKLNWTKLMMLIVVVGKGQGLMNAFVIKYLDLVFALAPTS
jgi:hypothetical protein